jgi:5-methylcytosine-specific restriction endonuclease McrA
MMQGTHELKSIPDDELLRQLAEILRQSRRVEADLVAHIGEVDRRRLYARTASPSMFAYATEVLHLSEAEAYLRIAAARASREHPILLAMLSDGRLHLTAIAKLAPHITPENRDALLSRAAHRCKREIEELVAELAPRPDVPELMRRLPDRRGQGSTTQRADPGREAPSRELRLDGVGSHDTGSRSRDGISSPSAPTFAGLRPDGVAGRDAIAAPGPEGLVGIAAGLRPDGVAGAPAAGRGRHAVVESLAPGRHMVQFTASTALRDKLERLRRLMEPQADLASIIEQAVSEKLERLEARRFARARKPRKALAETDTSPRTRQIPAAVKRAVYERDGGRCRYVDELDRRCTARERLEFHHRHPFGHGGDHSVQNIALACRLHNRVLAEADYGRRAMALHRGQATGAVTGTPSLSP